MEERPVDRGVGGSVRALQCTGTRLPSHLYYPIFRYSFPLFVLDSATADHADDLQGLPRSRTPAWALPRWA